jgi:hypothetical protein
MPRPVRSLLYAADRYPRRGAQENRLTEIFAEVLRTSPRLARSVAGVAFKDIGGISDELCLAEVTTQFQLAGGAERPDIRVTFDDGPRGMQRVFYIEDKLYAGLTEAQKGGYTATGEAPIVLIAPEHRDDVHPESFKQTTWSAVAAEAWRLGVESAASSPVGWPEYAWTPDAPGEVRLLAEFAAYLEREIDVRSQASLTTKDLEILPDAQVAVLRWDGLFDVIQQRLAKDPGTRAKTARFGPDGQVGRLGTGWDLRLKPDDRGWPALHQHWERNEQSAPAQDDRFSAPSLLMAASVPWDLPADQVPAVGVGITVGCANGWPYGLGEDEHLYRAARAQRFTLGITGSTRLRIFKTRPLRDLTGYPTLEDQANEIVMWARKVIKEFETLGL